MPYDFILMRFPRPAPAGLEAPNQGPQPILRGQIQQSLAGMAEFAVRTAGSHYVAEPAGGLHVAVHVDPKDPPEFITVEFDRYATPADYLAVRALVDQLCTALRLTITDDPDAGADLQAALPAGGSGWLDRLRGLFGR